MRTAGVSVVISHSACGIQGTRARKLVRRTHGPTLFFLSFFLSFFISFSLSPASPHGFLFFSPFPFLYPSPSFHLNASLPLQRRSFAFTATSIRANALSRHSQAVQDIASYPAGSRVRSKWFLSYVLWLIPVYPWSKLRASNSPPLPARRWKTPIIDSRPGRVYRLASRRTNELVLPRETWTLYT